MKFTQKALAISFVLMIGIVAGMLITGSFDMTPLTNAEETPKLGSDKPMAEEILALQNTSRAFVAIAKDVTPSVVSITSEKVVHTGDLHPFFDDPFFRRFMPDIPDEQLQQGLGSGVIVSSDGYILTNNHVVEDADEIEVHLNDNKSYEAEIVGTDPKTDVAVIRIVEEVHDLPVARLGDSDKLEVGEWVLAIGSPFGFSSTVTQGIVSALGRNVGLLAREGGYEDFIQTDAAINPGNSGGALVNMSGELIGINTAISTRSGGYDGIGFAIPINMARNIMEKLITDGKVARGWLGIWIENLDATMAEAMGLDPDTRGVIVNDVMEDSPALEAGLERGDVIVGLNGDPVTDVSSLRNRIAGMDPGTKIKLEYYRDGKKKTVSVTLGELDSQTVVAEHAEPEVSEKIGIEVATITSERARRYRLDENVEGLVITSVTPRSVAAKEGLRPGDVILEINRHEIKSIKDFQNEMKNLEAGDAVLFLIQRDENTMFVALKVPKDVG
ncbi:MAG: DegQ family serine endoprotease [Gemmatimonadetes bacterium]|nr:MAG: DegQ family serine endoprotease [Gemmatimonadota bacterium]